MYHHHPCIGYKDLRIIDATVTSCPLTLLSYLPPCPPLATATRVDLRAAPGLLLPVVIFLSSSCNLLPLVSRIHTYYNDKPTLASSLHVLVILALLPKHTHIHTYIHTYFLTYLPAHMPTYINICLRAFIHLHIRARTLAAVCLVL